MTDKKYPVILTNNEIKVIIGIISTYIASHVKNIVLWVIYTA